MSQCLTNKSTMTNAEHHTGVNPAKHKDPDTGSGRSHGRHEKHLEQHKEQQHRAPNWNIWKKMPERNDETKQNLRLNTRNEMLCAWKHLHEQNQNNKCNDCHES
jgi:hypothetical protein